MLYILALLLAAHGIAHLPGFLALWKLKDFPELPYKTTLLAGHLDVGDLGARIVGLLFLLAGLAFVAAGIAVWFKTPSGKSLALYATCFSLILTGLAWPEARIGVFVNLALLALIWKLP
jgi:hypothetical protein